MGSPAAVAPAPRENGEPASSVKTPLVPTEKPEMVPDELLETYKKPAVGETARNCGFGATRDANAKEDPETGGNRPRAGSMLKTEIEQETPETADSHGQKE